MKIIYGAVIFLVIFCVSLAYGLTNQPDATGHETLKNRDKSSDHITEPIERHLNNFKIPMNSTSLNI